MKQNSRIKRHKKIRARIKGTQQRPRLSVFRSNKFITAQIIDDDSGKTIAYSSSLKLKGKPIEKAKEVGLDIAKKAIKNNIKKIVFDRGGYAFTGKVKELANGAKQGGLEF